MNTVNALVSSAIESAKPLLFISAAEPSADQHGASLIRATLSQCPTARFVGVAGPKMVAAGCERIYDMTRHSAMLLGAVGAMGRAWVMLQTADRHLRRYPFDAAVVIDSPTLHLPLAARAQAAGVPVLYYIAPQMWAWGKHRIHKLRDRAEHVAVILPFEEAFFRQQGIEATYVGHPLAAQLSRRSLDESVVQRLQDSGAPVIAILPGSRKHVVREVFRGQLEVASRIAAEMPRAVFGVSVANEQVAPFIREQVSHARVPIQMFEDQHGDLLTAADLVLVASGTTTLEVACYHKPMIVMYNTSRLFYHLVGRWMVRTPHLSLPNILAGRRIVPEFMPYYTSTRPIAACALALLRNEQERQTMIDDLIRTTEPLRGLDASQQTAALLLDMAHCRHHG